MREVKKGTRELLDDLKIDSEFEGKIPPLTAEEFQQLRENILEAGEAYDPIRVWNGVVVDGHNRLKVIRENPDIRWSVREMEFADKWAAFDWMYKNQLGRRNLTDEQRSYMIGKMYEARKKSVGGQVGNNNASKRRDQNGPIVTRNRVYEQLADELSVGANTVKRAEKFSKGIDALREISPEAADKVLSGKTKATKAQISMFGKLGEMGLELQEQAAPLIVNAIEKDEKLPAITNPSKRSKNTKPESESEPQTVTTEGSCSEDTLPKNQGYDADTREIYRMIERAYAPMRDTGAKSTYDMNDLAEEIRLAGEMCATNIKSTLDDRKYLLRDDAAWGKALAAIAEVIENIQSITTMREEFTA